MHEKMSEANFTGSLHKVRILSLHSKVDQAYGMTLHDSTAHSLAAITCQFGKYLAGGYGVCQTASRSQCFSQNFERKLSSSRECTEDARKTQRNHCIIGICIITYSCFFLPT